MRALRPLEDVDEASDSWGANCGPGALAAALGFTRVNDVRAAFAPFPGYTNVLALKRAIGHTGAKILRVWSRPSSGEIIHELLARDPDGGCLVMMVEWNGPWSSNPRARAAYRHVIALDRITLMVGDVNHPKTWVSMGTWVSEIVPILVPDRWSGTVTVAWAAELDS